MLIIDWSSDLCSSDLDALARFHCRCRAVCRRHRCRLGNAPIAGYDRVLRNARGHDLRLDVYAGVLHLRTQIGGERRGSAGPTADKRKRAMKRFPYLRPLVPKAVSSSLMLSAMLAGCAVGPDYKAPEVDMAPFPNAGAVADRQAGLPAPTLAHWWTGFNEQMLETVV